MQIFIQENYVIIVTNMFKFTQSLCLLLALGLPWHGMITVFFPEGFRFWKEIVLLALGILVGWGYMSNFLNSSVKNRQNELTFGRLFRTPDFWALLFLGWGSVLVFLKADPYTSAVAFRYLGLGFFAFVLHNLICKSLLKPGKSGHKNFCRFFKKFSTFFVWSTVLSTIFGLWGKFLGGFEVLKNFYSQTISSWVPGQTLPLYHQTSEGFIRIQGGASGPVEFAHILLLALFVQCFFIRRFKWFDWGVIMILGLGIFQSGSRAGILGAGLLIVANLFWRYVKFDGGSLKKIESWVVVWLMLVCVLAMTKLGFSEPIAGDISFLNKKIVRISDSDHITRPIQAFYMGLENPVTGNLGELGPAARAKNLAINNNDKAPIAENVFVDYFAQLGGLGLFLAVMFWGSLYLKFSFRWICMASVFLLLMNFATILDMTPLAILIFIFLAFGRWESEVKICEE